MTSALSVRLDPEFDAFLYAPIDDESNGQQLSVISVLARLDLDPWHEAVSLASLPVIDATERLTSLIATLPGGLASHLVPATIASRLAGLLPGRGAAAHSLSRGKRDAAADAAEAVLNSGLVIGTLFFLIVLGSQWITSNKETTTKIDTVPVQTTSAPAPKILPSN